MGRYEVLVFKRYTSRVDYYCGRTEAEAKAIYVAAWDDADVVGVKRYVRSPPVPADTGTVHLSGPAEIYL